MKMVQVIFYDGPFSFQTMRRFAAEEGIPILTFFLNDVENLTRPMEFMCEEVLSPVSRDRRRIDHEEAFNE